MGDSAFKCPNPKCRAELSIPWELRGLCVRCSRCGETFVAPLSARVFLEAFMPPKKARKAG